MINFDDFWFQGYKEGSLMNAQENENSYLVELRAVGVKKEDIKINFEDDVLVVKSENKKASEQPKWLRREFHKDTIDKRIIVPGDSDRDNVKARVEDGILVIEIPKLESKKSVILVE